MNDSIKPDLEESTNVRTSHRDVDRQVAASAREMNVRENGQEPISSLVVVSLVIVGLIAGGVLFKDSLFNFGESPEGYMRGKDPSGGVAAIPKGKAADVYYEKGKALYAKACGSCHGGGGAGSATIPPLVASEWVSKSDVHFLSIAMNGVTGPISVNGASYNSTMPAQAGKMNDYELASLATYVRNSFSNNDGERKITSIEQIQALRARLKGRPEGPVTVKELLSADRFKGQLKGAPLEGDTDVNKKTGETL